MDAGRMVDLSEDWTTVPPQHICQTVKDRTEASIPALQGGSITSEITTDGCAGTSGEVRYLEHVQARVSLRFLPRGNINIKLISPSGTTSTLLFERPRDVFLEKFDDWPFLSVHFWGEKAAGTWRLIVTNGGTRQVHHPGVLIQWQLILHGTREHPERLRSEGAKGFPLSPTQISPLSGFPSRRPTGDPFTLSILDQILAGSSPEATYATPDGTIITGPNQLAAHTDSVDKYIESEVCHSQCLGGCSGPGSDKCKSCRHFDLKGECVNNCPEIMYGSLQGMCLPCHASCLRCSGASANQCLSCRAPTDLYVLHLGICVPSCPPGYYAENKSCVSCNGNCVECSGLSFCTKCNYNQMLVNGTCVSNCPKRFFKTQQNTCGSCFPQCETCVGGSILDCATCKPNTFLARGKCVHHCHKGTYGDPNSGECLMCPSGCSGCNSETCTSCSEGWRLKSGRCVALRDPLCQIHEYSISDGRCEPCHSSCLKCVGAADTQCLHCIQNRFLLISKCVTACPDGHFARGALCRPCPHGCATCSSKNTCTSCSEKYFLHRSQCVPVCPNGYYGSQGSCVLCDAACQTCYGTASNQCASCPPEAFLLQGSCYNFCPDGYYAKDKSCALCYQNCATCNGPGLSECISCREFLTLNSGMCLECASGQYFNESSQKCESCHSSCLTCSADGRNSCSSCESPLSIHPESGSCRPCCTELSENQPCCECDTNTGLCYGASSADKRRIALSLPRINPEIHKESYFSSISSLIAVICLVNLVIFGAGFIILQARSTGSLCWSRDYSYRKLPVQSSNMSERVSLTLTPFTEEDSEDEAENELLFTRT